METVVRYSLLLVIIIAIVAGVFLTAQYVAQSDDAIIMVEKFGILGIIFVAFIGGLNIIVPIPVATLTPIFEAANFSLPVIIIALVIGTSLADMAGYGIGRLSRHASSTKYPEFQKRLQDFSIRHHRLILPVVIVWASIVPLPNEVLLVPLGLMGYGFRLLILPLIVGTIFHQTLYAFGISNVFTWIMG